MIIDWVSHYSAARRGLIAVLALVAVMATGAGLARGQDQTPEPGQEPIPLQQIVAVINDDVITSRDLEDRIRLAMIGAGLPRTQESRERIAPEVLNQLIDETLQFQEAERQGARIRDAAMEEALGEIAQRNNMSWDQFSQALAREGVNPRTLARQIEAQLVWRNIVQRRLAGQSVVGDQEIDAELARIAANQGRPEYLLAEILLPVDDPTREAEVRAFAEELVTRIRQGAQFSAVARQFSQGPGAQTGGDLGWVMEGVLAPELERVVQTLGPRDVSDPIRTLEGYHIMLMRDRREIGSAGGDNATVALYRLGLGWQAGAPQGLVNRANTEVNSIAANVRGCEDFAARARALGVGDGIDMGTVRVGDLEEGVRALVRDLPVGVPTEPQRVPNGVLVYMVCDRQVAEGGGLPSREEIGTRILNQRLNLLSRRYLRDLRNTAFIDVRM